jgi:hypothetical protein
LVEESSAVKEDGVRRREGKEKAAETKLLKR